MFEWAWWLASWALGISIFVACFRNVFWDSYAVEQLAQAAVCRGQAVCTAQMTQMMRTPIGHSYDFLAGTRHVEVSCRREFYLFGDYSCGGGVGDLLAQPTQSAPTASSKSAPTDSAKPSAASPKPVRPATAKPAPAVSAAPAPGAAPAPSMSAQP
jgi:hypothetical protein